MFYKKNNKTLTHAMPFLTQIEIQKNIFLGIWKMDLETENLDFFEKIFPLPENDAHYLQQITHHEAKLRSLVSRYVLKTLLESQFLCYEGITHSPQKKPFLKNLPDWDISISHSEKYCGAVIAYKENIGFDLEQIQPKIQKIAPKFIHELEKENFYPLSLLQLTQIWASKEAMYKLYGEKKMIFKTDLQVLTLENAINKGVFLDKNQHTWINCDLFMHQWEDVCGVVAVKILNR